jgi:mannose-6-phosphate isomerase-like protein (cupin superfamily)
VSKKIEVCEKDTYYLNKLTKEGLVKSHDQPVNYRDRVVLKPWGYEFLAFENEHVAIWFLHIKRDHATSMHCHPQKKTTLAVLSGEAFCHTFLTRNSLAAMDAVEIEKGVFHSTTALSDDGTYLLELETPPNKTDLVRFNDSYGREKHGYEPTSHMVDTNLEQFSHFHFLEGKEANAFASRQFKVSLHQFDDNNVFRERFSLSEGEKALICRGSVSWGDQDRKQVGEIFDHKTHAGQKLWIHDPVTLFKLQKA